MHKTIINRIKGIQLEKANSLIIIGIDGGGGSGKTTLADKIALEFTNTTIVHMDDLYKQKKYRVISNLAQAPAGYEYDIERIISDIIMPLRHNQEARYQKYDWNRDCLDKFERIKPNGIVIIEGCYSTIKQLRNFYDFTIFIDTKRETRLKRGLERDGELALSFWNNWMKGEDKYFAEQNVKKCSDFVFDGNDKS